MLLISAELDEIYALSDRIVTLYEGRITGEYPPDAPAEEVGRGMLGGGHREGGGLMAAAGAALPQAQGRQRPEWLESFGGPGRSRSSAPSLIAMAIGSVIIVLYGESPLTVYCAILDGLVR